MRGLFAGKLHGFLCVLNKKEGIREYARAGGGIEGGRYAGGEGAMQGGIHEAQDRQDGRTRENEGKVGSLNG